MKSPIVLLALGVLCAGTVTDAGSFSVYFNGESPSTDCHIDNASNAQLSTSGNGNLLITAAAPLAFSSACGISGNGQQLTFGPAQPLQGPSAPLAAGTNVTGSFSVLPLNATSCTVTYTGAGAPPGANVCGSPTPSCSSSTPINFSANFTNTGTNSTSYQATVTCQSASGASPASLQSSVTVTQNGNSGGTPVANFICTQTASLTIGCTDQSTESGGTIGSWSWAFGDGGTSTLQNPSHVYSSAGTKTVTLTVADSVNPSNIGTLQKQVSVTTGSAASCTTGQTGDLAGYTALCSGSYTRYSPNATTKGPSAYTYDFLFDGPWPGATFGASDKFTLGTTQFLSVPFVPSPGHTITITNNATYTQNKSVVYSISTQPGLFNGGAPNGTTVQCVFSGASASLVISSNGTTSACQLNPANTYWLNMVPGIYPPGGGGFVGCANSPCYVAPRLANQTN